MMTQLPYAIAIIAVAAFCWDVARRFLAAQQRELDVVHQFNAMRRDFDLLDVKTKKAIENIAVATNEQILKVQGQVAFEEAKRGLAPSRRIG